MHAVRFQHAPMSGVRAPPKAQDRHQGSTQAHQERPRERARLHEADASRRCAACVRRPQGMCGACMCEPNYYCTSHRLLGSAATDASGRMALYHMLLHAILMHWEFLFSHHLSPDIAFPLVCFEHRSCSPAYMISTSTTAHQDHHAPPASLTGSCGQSSACYRRRQTQASATTMATALSPWTLTQ